MTSQMRDAQQRAVRAESKPRVLTAVAVIVRTVPAHDHTHMLREVEELERQGQPVLLVPLVRRRDGQSAAGGRWSGRSLHLPRFSREVVLALARQLVRRPVRLATILALVLASNILHPVTLFRTLYLLPRVVFLAGELRRRRIRHVHAYSARYAATAAWIVHELTGISYSFGIHGPDVFTQRALLRRKIAGAKFVRSVSLFNEAFLRGIYPEIPEERIEVVHRGVNPDLYERSEERPDAAGGRMALLSVASLLPNKGLDMLVEACATLLHEGVDLECRIIGDGPLLESLRQEIESLQVSASVHLLGAQPQDEVVRQVTACDVFVLSGTIAPDGQMDGIPMSLIEAMAAGKPVVAPAISGIPELVSDGVSGLLVDSTNPARIAASVRTLASDPELRARMGEAARRRVLQRFDVRRTAGTLIELFERHEATHPPLAARIAALDLPELRGTAVTAGAVHERRDSLVAELQVTGLSGARQMVLKQHRSRAGESRPAPERARHEGAVLEMLGSRLGMNLAEPEASFRVPRVLAVHAENAVLLMSRAAGDPLDLRLRALRTSPRATGPAVVALRRTGAWLREMQRVTRTAGAGHGILAEAVRAALADLDLAAAADRQLAARRDWIAGRLRDLQARAAAAPLAVAGHHGDFWPGNVFVSAHAVEVIDFEGFRDGLLLEDAAWFLVHLELPFAIPPFGRLFSRLRDAFLDGYLGADGELDRPVLRLLLAAKALHVLAAGGLAQPDSWMRSIRRRALRSTILRSLV